MFLRFLDLRLKYFKFSLRRSVEILISVGLFEYPPPSPFFFLNSLRISHLNNFITPPSAVTLKITKIALLPWLNDTAADLENSN